MANEEKRVLKIAVLEPEPPHVDISVEAIQREETPLITSSDLDHHYIIAGGREIVNKLRNMALGSEPLTSYLPQDDSFDEKNPFEGPAVRRSQLPIYADTLDSYRQHSVASDEDYEFTTPKIIAETVNRAIESIPHKEKLFENATEYFYQAADWVVEKINALQSHDEVNTQQPPEPKKK